MIRSVRAERHLRLVLIGFAASVILTRSFLAWTGYPQIAAGDFHIAHVLWGGLLLFIAALVLLVWRGPAVYSLASLLGGAGFGLFIDEVGKFITQSNDYFYPLAAPIIYACFLLTVVLYLHVRRPSHSLQAISFFHVLDLLEHGAGTDLDGDERKQVSDLLGHVSVSGRPPVAAIAAAGLTVLQEIDSVHAQGPPNISGRRWHSLPDSLNLWFTATRLKKLVTAGFALLALRGLASALAAFFFIFATIDPVQWQQMGATSTPLSSGGPFGATHLTLVALTLCLEGIVGGLFLAATAALLTRRVDRGANLGYWALILSLTVVRLLVIYFSQFDVILTTLLQFVLLLAVLRLQSLQPPERTSAKDHGVVEAFG